MGRLEQLIAELCPNGVKFVKLGSFSISENSGVDKKININEKPIKLLNYMDVYRNKKITKDIITMEVTASDKKIEQCNLKAGDIFITPTSETINDIGHAGVVVEDIPNTVYSYHIMRIRIIDNKVNPYFISYLFESETIQKQILKMATGLTRFGLSKGKFENLLFPIPPLLVQNEIVRILDNFTELTTELKTKLTDELTARKKQYKYYKKSLFSQSSNTFVTKLGEVATLKTGSKPKEIFEDKDEFEYVNAGTSISGYVRTFNCEGDTVTTPSRGQGGIGFVGYQKNSFWLGPLCYRIKSKDINILLNSYLYHYLSCFNDKIMQFKNEGGTPSVNASDLVNIVIDIPSLEEQERIVAILDHFDALYNDLTNDLPAEIEARQKQYEYYRDKLLAFKEVTA